MSTNCGIGSKRGRRVRQKLAGGRLPQLQLPGGRNRVIDTARLAGQLLGATGRFFIRGGKLFELQALDGQVKLEHVKAAKFVSAIEEVARVVRWDESQKRAVPTIFTSAAAGLVLESSEFAKAIPEIRCITRCPVLIERDGRLVQVAAFDRASGILAGGVRAADLGLDEARSLLRELLTDFHFVSQSDRSRAFAALLSPALTFGGLLGAYRAPAIVVEANESQTGKGFFVRLIAAVYRDVPAAVTQKKGGVGGLEEDFDSRILEGRSFINFDNMRGRFDSPKLESFLTEDTYSARVPYAGSIQIDPRRTIVLLTSNRAELTPDLANRANTVRLLKQPIGYAFASYAEGGLPQHVHAHQPQFLGAVFATIREWHAAGKLASKGIDHDFRGWAGALNWIVMNILNEAPLMAGHREAQRRMATPDLNWLRDVANAVESSGRVGQWLRANQVVDAIQGNSSIEIPGLRHGDIEDPCIRDNVFRAVGLRLSKCLGDASKSEVDGFIVERRTTTDREDGYRERTEYRFEYSTAPKSARSDPEGAPRRKTS